MKARPTGGRWPIRSKRIASFRATPPSSGRCRSPTARPSPPVELEYEFIKWVEKRVDLEHPEKHRVLQDWKATVQALEKDPLSLHDRLDWAAKYHLLDAFRQQEKLEWDSPWLQSLDLEYHLLKHDEGLFLRAGKFRRHAPAASARRKSSTPCSIHPRRRAPTCAAAAC